MTSPEHPWAVPRHPWAEPEHPWAVSTWCCERLTLQQGDHGRTVLTCVDRSGQCETVGHRSGTDPVVRWRTNRQDPSITDAWVEPWRDWAGRTVAERQAAGLVT